MRSTLERLTQVCLDSGPVTVFTDKKHTYRTLLSKALGDRLVHRTTSSRDRRDTRNPLFQINLTLAMLRDGISRLVRRTWGASKLRRRLEQHLWIWIVYRNYVRGMTNKKRHVTPAMAVGLHAGPCRWRDLLRERIEVLEPAS